MKLKLKKGDELIWPYRKFFDVDEDGQTCIWFIEKGTFLSAKMFKDGRLVIKTTLGNVVLVFCSKAPQGILNATELKDGIYITFQLNTWASK